MLISSVSPASLDAQNVLRRANVMNVWMEPTETMKANARDAPSTARPVMKMPNALTISLELLWLEEKLGNWSRAVWKEIPPTLKSVKKLQKVTT